MAKRPKVPFKVSQQVLYATAWTCCVCRQRRVFHLHHIDSDPSNNTAENLGGLCNVCHDEAHTAHKLSQNLTPERIANAKQRWEENVKRRSAEEVIKRQQTGIAMWTYFNHARLHEFLKMAACRFNDDLLKELRDAGLVDSFGVPQHVQEPSQSRSLWTAYDWLPRPLCHKARALNADAVDCIVARANPVMLDAIWQKKLIRVLVRPGTICFCTRGFYFKTVLRDTRERLEERLAYAQARAIRIELRISTRDMFGSSSVHDSFKGRRCAAALFVVKSVAHIADKLVISGTPIALGVGFAFTSQSPYGGANVPTGADFSANHPWRLTSEWLDYASSK